MANGSVDGLISGLSTSSLISQLMQVEKAGQNRLKTKVTTQQSVISSFQAINTKLATLKSAATAVSDTSVWQQTMSATSSSDAVTATAGPSAKAGQLTFTVDRLAQANVQTATLDADTPVLNLGTIDLTIGGQTTTLAVEDNTAQGVVDAINGANLGVRASLVETDQGTKLQVASATTGSAGAFTLTGLNTSQPDDSLDTLSAAQDARITVGTVGQGGYTVTSASNTFSNLMPGVTVTANKEATNVTVTTATNVDALATKMQALVDAANGVMTEIGTQTAATPGTNSSTGSNSNTGSAKPLAGNSLARQIQSNVLSAVTTGKADYGSFQQLGIESDRYGKLSFNKEKFVAAYNADPAKTQAAVTEGVGQAMKDLATAATTNITNVIQSGNNAIRDLNDQIDKWDVRLQLRQEALQKQFSNLEVALGKMQDQASWLAGQINSLG